MTASGAPPLRYLSAADVTAAMPPLAERLRLAERTMTALVADAELPPKIGVHPRPAGSFAHAMPAHLRATRAVGDGADPDPTGADDPSNGANDLVGMKWIAGFPTNGARGLAAIHGLVILNDPRTGVPTAILDAGPITAERTAAISGVAIGRFAPEVRDRPVRVAMLGAGVQARSHLAVIGHLLPGLELRVFDRHADRATALVAAAAAVPGIGAASVVPEARSATGSADVVLTMASFAPAHDRQALTEDWLGRDVLVVAVDYATYVNATVARAAALFIVDQREQFLANRDAGQFDGYPDPGSTLGEALLGGTARPAGGHVLVTHLGVGLADLVFGEAILRRAAAEALGTILAR